MFDEDENTAYSGGGSSYTWGSWKVLEVDLGGPLPISRIVLYSTPEYADQRFVTEFTIAVNDGDERKNGLRGAGPALDPPAGLVNRSIRYAREYGTGSTSDWEEDGIVFSATQNRISRLDLEVKSFPTQKIFLIGRSGIWEIAELEIYGNGYVPQASYRSNILDLGQPSTLGELVWSGEQGPDATVDLITRSGEKAGISPDTGNWQFWSTPLDFDGGEAPLAADRPRQYVQFDVDLRSSNTASSGRLDYLEFRAASPPIVSQIVAEIAPRSVPARTMTQFRYLLLPRLFDTDIGFDSIEIDTATEVASVDSVRINDVYLDRSEWDWTPGEGSFVVNLPHVDLQRTDELIEIVFQTEVFKYGTVFKGRVFDSSRLEEPRQLVAAGAADELVDSNTLTVGLANLGQSSIQALQLSSPVATPDGDGVNDVIEISFDLINLSGQCRLRWASTTWRVERSSTSSTRVQTRRSVSSRWLTEGWICGSLGIYGCCSNPQQGWDAQPDQHHRQREVRLIRSAETEEPRHARTPAVQVVEQQTRRESGPVKRTISMTA